MKKKNNISYRPGTVIMKRSASKSPITSSRKKSVNLKAGKSAKQMRAKVMDIIHKT